MLRLRQRVVVDEVVDELVLVDAVPVMPEVPMVPVMPVPVVSVPLIIEPLVELESVVDIVPPVLMVSVLIVVVELDESVVVMVDDVSVTAVSLLMFVSFLQPKLARVRAATAATTRRFFFI